MLIMDELISWTMTVSEKAKERGFASPSRTMSVLTDARRFVIDPAAVAIVRTLLKNRQTLKRAAEHLFFPAGNTWIEWHDPGLRGRVALHFVGNSDTESEDIHGGALTVHRSVDGILKPMSGMGLAQLDSLNSEMPFFIRPISSASQMIERLSKTKINRHTIRALIGDEPADPEMDEIGTMMLGFLALLNSPRMVHMHKDTRQKLNKHRQAKGKYPLLAHEAVRINLAKHDYDAVIHDSDGASRPLHFVRAYLRVQYGELQLIYPHWRGDPALGIKTPKYDVTHKET
jgi:hypothetical protein